MAMHTQYEIEIFARLFQPENADLSPDAARSLLAVEFTAEDKQQMRDLAEKARAGTLSAQEQEVADSYSFVGNLLGILKSKARRSLGEASNGSSA